MNICKILQEERENRSLSIYQLSKTSGIPWSSIKSYENGRIPPVDVADTLLKTLGISLQIGYKEARNE